MAGMLVLTEADLRRSVPLDREAVSCVERGFAALAGGGVIMPPILRLDIPERRAEVDVKTAYIPGFDGFAIKISPGFFDNPKRGLPSTNGLMVLFSAETGLVNAVLLDNGYLTDVRTAAAGAVAARHLARPEAKVAAIFGAGMQARMQLRALALVRPIASARIWARDGAKAASTAAEMSAELRIPVTAESDGAVACRGADIIVTTTPAEKPILRAAWLSPGQHVTAMGSDAGHKNEVEPAALLAAAPYVADSLKQTRQFGELHHAIAAGLIAPDRSFAELGAVVTGELPGRRSAKAITFCDLTGTGVQDTAIATLAYQRALATSAGHIIENSAGVTA
jgi:ornithine cyclodeaminase